MSQRRLITSWPASVAVLVLLALSASGSAGEQGPTGPHSRAPSIEVADALLAEKLPRVRYLGGPFLRRPRVVTITERGDDPALVARLERFGATVTRTGWWREATSGYCASPGECIGAGRPGSAVRLDTTLPAAVTDVDVAGLLAEQLRAGRLGPVDGDTLLLFYLPEGVALSDATGTYCGGGPRAIHRALRLGGRVVAYAVVPRCGDEAQLTATASHEIVEAATNPDPARRGFAFQGGSADGGFTAAGLEPVDPCGLITLDRHRTTAAGFTVQRAWSNRAAELGRNPCLLADRPYVALVPREPAVRLRYVGDTATLIVDAAADRPTEPWQVSVIDLADLRGRQPCVRAEIDTTTVRPGATIELTVTLVHKDPDRYQCHLGLVSTVDRERHLWPLTIVTR